MNIALFTETYYPEVNGVANSAFVLKQELERMGHNVYVFTTTTPRAPEYEYNVFRVRSIPCILITERRVGMFYQPKLAGIIKKLNLDLIHTQTEFSLGIFGRIMARELQLPMIHTYHTIYEDYTHYVTKGKLFDERAKTFARWFSRHCCNNVQRVIVPTEKVKELLVRYQVNRQISVIPTGINLKKFIRSNYKKEEIIGLKKECGIPLNDKIILYLGRISQEKNLIEIIKAMPEYLGRHADASMVIVGGGPAKDALEKEVEQAGLSGRIYFLGEQPWDDIGIYYQLGDVFVSASNSETQGLTYIEAMAAGLPVVAREDQCLDEILFNGENGWTFHDRAGLIKGLDAVLYSGHCSDNAVSYREKAETVAAKYSTEEFALSVANVYEEVLEDQAGKNQRSFADL